MSAFTLTAPIRLIPGSKTLDREATLEPNGDIIRMGVHGPIAEHYKSSPVEPLLERLGHGGLDRLVLDRDLWGVAASRACARGSRRGDHRSCDGIR